MPPSISLQPTWSRAVLVMTGLVVGGACKSTVDPIEGGPSGSGGAAEQSVSATSSSSALTSAGGFGQGGAGQGGASTSVGGASASSIALYRSELPQGSGGSSVASTGAGGAAPGEEDLLLFVANVATACSDPFGDGGCAASGVRATLTLAPAVQAVGTYLLTDPRISTFYAEWGPGGAECMGSGGSFVDGSITITSIDGAAIAIELAGTAAPALDGAHLVVRCNPIAEPTSLQLAYFPSDLPGEGGAGPGSAVSVGVGGSGGGTEKLVLDFADHAQVCSDPNAGPGPGQSFQDFLVSLPPEYVAPGVYSLADPAIETRHLQLEENTAVSSGGGDAPGTLTIFEVTDAYVDLALEGSVHDFANVTAQVPRCGG